MEAFNLLQKIKDKSFIITEKKLSKKNMIKSIKNINKLIFFFI
jgi:hypothetical protein